MQAPAKYLVIINSAGSSTALMFTAARVQVADFDASSEEVAVMTSGIMPEHSANAREWDHALAGHAPADREAAQVYTLDV